MPGLLLFRWDARLFFASAELFKERALDAAASSATKVKWVVVAAEPVTSVDVTAAEADTVDLLFLENSRTRRAGASLVLFVWCRTQRSRSPGADRYCVGAGAAAGAAG